MRFEVFKRDSFTCQYCGAKAPDVVLQVDHIRPVADGGGGDILNLISSCQPCNGGKGARPLDDQSAVEKQRRQLEDLQARREQIDMMLSWRDELSQIRRDTVQEVADRIANMGGWVPTEGALADLRRWLRRYSVEEVLSAAEKSFDIYLEYDGDSSTVESFSKAFKKIPGIIGIDRQAASKPYLPRLFYIQGILRNRSDNRHLRCVDALESFVEDGLSVDTLEVLAKRSDDWEEFRDLAEAAVGRLQSEE